MEQLNSKQINIIDINESQREYMYDLYVESYKTNRWYKNSSELFNAYNCVLIYTNDYNKIVGYFMLINTKFGKKISLSSVINDNNIKQLMFNERAKLLVTPGFYQEADGPVSWILRSRYNLYPITNEEHIKKILQDKINKGDIIKMNNLWKFENKMTQVYTRFVISGDKTFENNESIYGIPCSISSISNIDSIFNGFVDYEITGTNCQSNCTIKQKDIVVGGYNSDFEKYKKEYGWS